MNPILIALQRQIDDAQAAIDAFRKECPHSRAQWVKEKEYSNRGDWDYPGTGLVITRWYHCGECGHFFTTTETESEPESVDHD